MSYGNVFYGGLAYGLSGVPSPPVIRSITDIDGDDVVSVGQTPVTITAVGLDADPSTQIVTLNGQALTVLDWNSGNPIVTIPVDINLKLGRTDLLLSVIDDTATETLSNVTLNVENGWEYVDFSGNIPDTVTTESGYELALIDLLITMVVNDQFIYRSETGLSFDVDTFPTIIPASNINSFYRVWDDDMAIMSVKTLYSIIDGVISGGTGSSSSLRLNYVNRTQFYVT